MILKNKVSKLIYIVLFNYKVHKGLSQNNKKRIK